MKSIVVLDCNAEECGMAGETLRRRGYEVHTATDAETALDYVTRHRCDLLITEVMLPGGDSGFAVARTACQRNAHLKIIYLTQIEVSNDSALGPILRKPYEPAELEAAVMIALAIGDSCSDNAAA